MDKVESFKKYSCLDYLADLLTGVIPPATEADLKFLEHVNKYSEEKFNAGNIKLRVPFRPQIPESEQQGSSEMSSLSKDV